LENSKNIKNSDLVAMVNNSSEQTLNLELKTNKHEYYATEDPNAQKIQIVNDKTKSEGKLVHEELKEGIFDEINNVVDANEELRREKKEFMLGENLFYHIYAERKHVNFRVDFFEIMCWSSLSQIYGPAIFWFSKIPSSNIAKIISEKLNKLKFPYGHFFVKIIGLLGKDVVTLISDKFNDVFKDNPQPPDYYYSFNKMIRSGEKNDIREKALNISVNNQFFLPYSNKKVKYKYLLNNPNEAEKELNNICFKIANGEKKSYKKGVVINLDVIANGLLLNAKAEKVAVELEKHL
jgi:hypothetical protein